MNSIAAIAESYPTWADRDHAAASLVAQMAGAAEVVDESDDAEVLRWARTYLPAVIQHGNTRVEAAR